MSIEAFFTGFALSFSLILAIGAQNAFILRQALRKQHIFWVCLTCALSDAILITLGVAGLGAVIDSLPIFKNIMLVIGAAFLIFFGLNSLRRALTLDEGLLPSQQASESLIRTLIICLALTWLNPHVYLDTVLLLGSIASQFEGARLAFGLGAVLASFIFFFAFGYGTSLLGNLFVSPKPWKILDFLIAIVMWVIAANILVELF